MEWNDELQGINSGCDPVPSEGRRDIDRLDIGCSNGQGGDKSDKLDGNGNGYMGEGLVHSCWSTMILVVEEFSFLQT